VSGRESIRTLDQSRRRAGFVVEMLILENPKTKYGLGLSGLRNNTMAVDVLSKIDCDKYLRRR
jgi:hypothetical protein